MADPKHPRHFSVDFKRQIVELISVGKPKSDVMREYDLCKSTVDRWVKAINGSGSPRAAYRLFGTAPSWPTKASHDHSLAQYIGFKVSNGPFSLHPKVTYRYLRDGNRKWLAG